MGVMGDSSLRTRTGTERKRDTWSVPFLLTLALSATACGGSFTKKEVFAAYGDDGRAMYYRINLEGSGYNGEVDYRAGWFDAQAVENLFGDVGAAASIQTELAKKHRESLDKALAAYLKALEDNTKDEIADRKKNFESALEAITGVAPAGGDRVATLDYSGKKFVMILSTNPDQIIAAINGRVQKNGLVEAIGAKLRESESDKAGAREADGRILSQEVKGLITALASAETGVSTASPAELSAQLSAIVQQAEAVR